MILIMCANSALDHLIEVKDLHLGTVHDGVRGFLTPGGKGLNVAVALSGLARPGRTVAGAGGEAGVRLQGLCRRAAVRVDWISTQDETRQNYIMVADGQSTVFNGPGPQLTKREVAAFETAFRKQMYGADALVLAGSLPPGAPIDLYARLGRRTEGQLLLVDAKGEVLRHALEARPDVVRVNCREAESLFGGPLTVGEAAERLHQAGVRYALVSNGEDWGAARGPDGTFWFKPPEVPVLNPVGSGDCMTAALLDALIGHQVLADALRWAVAAGSFKATRRRVQPLDRAALTRLAKEVTLLPHAP